VAEPSTDLATDLAGLRDEADSLLQQATTAQSRTTPALGRDGSGEVVVELDADGELTAVRVGFAWGRALRADQLPAAVLEAWTHAQAVRLESWASAYDELEREPAPAARPADPTDPGRSVTQVLRERIAALGGDTDAAAHVLEEVLAEVSVALEEANRLLDEHAGRTYTGRSGSHVRAEVTGGGDLLELHYDPGWLRRAHPGNLGRETTVAIRAAVRSARENGVRAAMRATHLGQLANLALDTPTKG
jgi:hypothetical protein